MILLKYGMRVWNFLRYSGQSKRKSTGEHSQDSTEPINEGILSSRWGTTELKPLKAGLP